MNKLKNGYVLGLLILCVNLILSGVNRVIQWFFDTEFSFSFVILNCSLCIILFSAIACFSVSPLTPIASYIMIIDKTKVTANNTDIPCEKYIIVVSAAIIAACPDGSPPDSTTAFM